MEKNSLQLRYEHVLDSESITLRVRVLGFGAKMLWLAWTGTVNIIDSTMYRDAMLSLSMA